MTKISPKIIFFGTEDHSLSSLKALVDNGFNVVAVITKPDAKSGRGQRLTSPPVKVYAKSQNIEVWQPTKLAELSDKIKDLQPVTGVLVAYGKIIPKSIIDLFSPGIINLHPSLLPRWRGPSPIEATIINQDEQAGVSIMLLDAEMDSGPIYTQASVQLSGHETKPELYNQLFTLGNELLVDNLLPIINGELTAQAQDDSKATYCSLLSKKDSLVDPSEMTSLQIYAHVRAYLGFPRTKMRLRDQHPLIITKIHLSDTAETDLSFRCTDEKYIIIDNLIAPSGKQISAKAYLNGYQKT